MSQYAGDPDPIESHDEPGDPRNTRVDAQEKALGATERDDQARGALRRRCGGLDHRRFVFVEECSTNLRMVPKNWEKNVTLISSI